MWSIPQNISPPFDNSKRVTGKARKPQKNMGIQNQNRTNLTIKMLIALRTSLCVLIRCIDQISKWKKKFQNWNIQTLFDCRSSLRKRSKYSENLQRIEYLVYIELTWEKCRTNENSRKYMKLTGKAHNVKDISKNGNIADLLQQTYSFRGSQH